MLKEQQAQLAHLITEIESTITTEQCRVISDRYNSPTRAVWTLDHKLIFDNQCLPVELVNELELLLQKFGQELMDYINSSCPPLPLAAAISTFVFNKERAKFTELQTKLNPSKEPEEIKDYKLSDYLILGYQFYDALFFTYFHSCRDIGSYIWGLKALPFEQPQFVKNTKKYGEIKEQKVTQRPQQITFRRNGLLQS